MQEVGSRTQSKQHRSLLGVIFWGRIGAWHSRSFEKLGLIIMEPDKEASLGVHLTAAEGQSGGVELRP